MTKRITLALGSGAVVAAAGVVGLLLVTGLTPAASPTTPLAIDLVGHHAPGPYSTDPSHYQPMCIPCHKRLDLDVIAAGAR